MKINTCICGKCDVTNLDYCYGCKNYICQDHDCYPLYPKKGHIPQDHIRLKEAINKLDKETIKLIEEITGEPFL